MKLENQGYLNNGRNPFPILERTPQLDLEHSKDVKEGTTPVSDQVSNRTIPPHKLRNPLLGFKNFLNDLPPFFL